VKLPLQVEVVVEVPAMEMVPVEVAEGLTETVRMVSQILEGMVEQVLLVR
jgi:hypothetical protein